MAHFRFGNKEINENSAPYVIAEIGVNHEGSFDLAKKLIDLAKEGGADAAKFQTYKAEKIAAKKSPSYWDLSKEKTTSQFELFKKYDTFGPDEYFKLSEHCKSVGIDYLSTPFDSEAVDFLDPLMSFFKIASADLTNIPFLRKIASKKKPVILSTGASTLPEIDLAVQTLVSSGVSEIALLHCVLNYPTPRHLASLDMITSLKKVFPDRLVGYSDHVPPESDMLTLTTSYLLGARIIEKHFTQNKNLPGNDHYHAMDVNDLKTFKTKVSDIRQLLGGSIKKPLETEELSRKNARRSIVTARNIRKGEIIDETMVTYKRPGTGISPLYWDDVVGRVVASDLEDDHIMQWRDLN